MIRRHFQLLILGGLLISLMVPFSIVSSQSTNSDSIATSAGPVFAADHLPDQLLHSQKFHASSIEYEFPDPPPERKREYCESVARLCQWYASHKALIDREPEAAYNNPVVPEEPAPEKEPEGDRNRSVVGWQSASISTLQNQKTAAPVALYVPSLSIEADVSGVGVDADRSMQVPDDYNTVGWYKHGPAPGDPGSSVIAGHLDDARGRSVFYDLQFIEIGAELSITREDGTTQTFTVTDKRSYDAGNIPAESIFSRDGEPRLAMITCSGSWDSSAGRYSETAVVYAEPS